MRTSTRSDTGAHLPTPEEIARLTARIRSTWSRHQRRVRAGLSPMNAVEVAVVTAGTLEGRRGSLQID
jgi:hypothetical protein